MLVVMPSMGKVAREYAGVCFSLYGKLPAPGLLLPGLVCPYRQVGLAQWLLGAPIRRTSENSYSRHFGE
jgi:hypothetical protein